MLTLHASIVKSYLSQFLLHFHIDQTFQFLLGGMCCILREEGSYFDLLTMGDLRSLYNIVTLGGFAHLLLSRCVALCGLFSICGSGCDSRSHFPVLRQCRPVVANMIGFVITDTFPVGVT